MIIGGSMLKIEIFAYNRTIYGRIVHKSEDFRNVEDIENEVIFENTSVTALYNNSDNSIFLCVGGENSVFQRRYESSRKVIHIMKRIKKAIEKINEGHVDIEVLNVENIHDLYIIGSDMLMLEIIHYNNIILGTVLKQSIARNERLCFSNEDYQIKVVSVPQLTKDVLFIRGTNTPNDNIPLEYIGMDKREAQMIRNRVIKALIEYHEKEGVECEMYSTKD